MISMIYSCYRYNISVIDNSFMKVIKYHILYYIYSNRNYNSIILNIIDDIIDILQSMI